jgi:phosphoribosylformylglycinamidine synthase
MNFGNPERPEVMGQFAGCVEGMAAACRVLDFPVVSGNVSLYNETNGASIPPTPSVGGLGLIDRLDRMATIAFKNEGEIILLVGATSAHLGSTLYLREVCGREDGAPPAVDLGTERRHGDFVRALIAAGRVSACHDLSDGGLLVGVAEMALAGGLGASLDPGPDGLPLHGWFFAEDQGRYLLAMGAKEAAPILAEAKALGIPCRRIGRVGGASLTGSGLPPISVAMLRAAHEGWMPAFMSGR